MSIFSGYESAGVSYMNGERVVSGNNANPYANANAPPAPVNQTGDSNMYHQSSSGSNSYPPYPPATLVPRMDTRNLPIKLAVTTI
jgi:hypothetical protein